ncbi:NAD(P)-dependent oxidoreductase [Marinibaculum pumilum]|uniref:NAD(P)-dependent oxidoreductase n=1 Tax=Marinibaculum pumilum TaxID=1766165 RepID=A0ABV7L191_9PROT
MAGSGEGQVTAYGFIGLGDMGGPMAANLTKAMSEAGATVWVYDKAGTAERAPEGAQAADGIAAMAAQAETVFLSVPDGRISAALLAEIVAAPDRRTTTIIDLSTVGVDDAIAMAETAAASGIAFADCPVSGGRAKAIAGTITMIFGGPAAVLERHRAALDAMGGNVFHVGEKAGQGSAMKLLNNYLSACNMAAASEAVTFGLRQGLQMQTILDVVNVSTGMNTATADKFPRCIVSGTNHTGFRAALLAKDVNLYLAQARRNGTPVTLSSKVAEICDAVVAEKPDGDMIDHWFHVQAQASNDR